MRVLSLLIFIISLSAFAKVDQRKVDIYKQALKHYQNQDYFTALDKIAQSYKFQTPDQNIQHFLEKLVTHTGTHYFNTFTDLELRKLNIPTTDLIMAKRNLYLDKFAYTHKRLKRMPKGHRLYPEALLVKATAYMKAESYTKAIKTYQECADSAFGWEKRTDSKQQNYFAVLKETCIINIARIHYKQKDYKLAIRHYEEIPKKSFKWPYTLMEKAWAYYYTGDYNRSLGILMTYNSPLLESYFMPEAEVLKAMNYFKLCLYEDALELIDRYYNTFAPRSKNLKALIGKQKSNSLFYFDLMFSPIEESEKKNKFIRNLVTQVSKRVKYSLDLNSYYAMNTEIYRANKGANLKLLLNMQTDLKEQINHYVKVSMYNFINEIHELSSEMFNLKLEILSRKRDLAYKNKTFSKDRSRGDFNNIKRRPDQEFYTFKSEFWADELGDYSLALTSTCKTRRIKPDEN
jgi:tetratricopeptide (TPR) repeat protein